MDGVRHVEPGINLDIEVSSIWRPIYSLLELHHMVFVPQLKTTDVKQRAVAHRSRCPITLHQYITPEHTLRTPRGGENLHTTVMRKLLTPSVQSRSMKKLWRVAGASSINSRGLIEINKHLTSGRHYSRLQDECQSIYRTERRMNGIFLFPLTS